MSMQVLCSSAGLSVLRVEFKLSLLNGHVGVGEVKGERKILVG